MVHVGALAGVRIGLLERPHLPGHQGALVDRLTPALLAPMTLARTIAAALAYRETTNPQAVTLAGETDLVGPAEVLEMISFLHPGDELSRLVCANYDDLTRRKVTL